MSTFPSLSDLLSPSNEGTFQAAITAFLNRAKELPGGTAETELIISGGQVTPTGPLHSIDTQSDASTDDLDNILLTNTPAGSFIIVRAENAARTVVIKNGAGGTGQIFTVDGADISLDDIKVHVGLVLVGTSWYEAFRGGISPATQAEQETGTSLTKAVTPGTQHYHDSANKFWLSMNGSGTIAIQDSYNVTSIADNGTGLYTITIATNFSTADWCAMISGGLADRDCSPSEDSDGRTAGAIQVAFLNSGGGAVDPIYVSVAGLGDQ